MAFLPAPGVVVGTRAPYHATSRARLSDITADTLRSAAVRLPSDDLRQTGTWIARGHLRFTPEARAVLPVIMGGACHVVPYDASFGSRAVVLRAAEMVPFAEGWRNTCTSTPLAFRSAMGTVFRRVHLVA